MPYFNIYDPEYQIVRDRLSSGLITDTYSKTRPICGDIIGYAELPIKSIIKSIEVTLSGSGTDYSYQKPILGFIRNIESETEGEIIRRYPEYQDSLKIIRSLVRGDAAEVGERIFAFRPRIADLSADKMPDYVEVVREAATACRNQMTYTILDEINKKESKSATIIGKSPTAPASQLSAADAAALAAPHQQRKK